MKSIQQQQQHFEPTGGEQLSALCDGELRPGALSAAVQGAVSSDAARETWATYHLVGDVLRSSELAQSRLGAGFAARVQARLAVESAPPRALMVQVGQVEQVRPATSESANQGHWKLVAGLASMALVALVAWTVFAPAGNGGAQLAQGPSPAAATLVVSNDAARADGVNAMSVAGAAAPQVMLRDARLDAFLQAHRQAGGNSALQMPAGFLRNATFDAPTR